jgi:ribonuclease E
MTDANDDRPSGQADAPQAEQAATPSTQNGDQAGEAKPKRSRGRRGGRGRRRKDKPAGQQAEGQPSGHPAEAEPAPSGGSEAQAIDAAYGLDIPAAGQAAPGADGQDSKAQEPKGRSRSRGRGRGKGKAAQPAAKDDDAPQSEYCEDLPEDASPASRAECKKKRKKMFIGVLPGELVEVVLTEDDAVQEYYVEMMHQAKTKGNIYKGYIHNIDSALQAAFINYGAERNGFLQIDEVHPEYYQGSYPLKKGARFPLIQKVLKAGQEVLVQVVKEPTGKKGAFVTSYLSLPGRYFVYTLGRDQQGVSRKIEDEKERERLKGVIEQISPPEGVGLIVRTAGIGRAKTELTRDYKYLHRLWGDIRKKVQTEKAPAVVYKELELAVRAARDYLTPDVSEVWVDDPDTAKQIREYVALAFPKSPNMVQVYAEHDKTLWERFGLTKQVEQIYAREVTLPSGGRLVFDHTEALTSVDINSGKIGGEQNFSKMALKTNTEAAQEIARQLKLRDIGGQVIIDFIEMKDQKHLREVEKTMRQALKSDRARTDVSGISPFGLMELVRQRLGSSAISVSTEPCPCCGGTGIRRNLEWQALQAMKAIHRLLRRPNCPNPLQFPVGQELAIYMLNNKRELLTEMGARVDCRVEVVVDPKLP